ncbi:MAG TPA: hypothetical protein VFY49_02990 [Myxococcota bacterium]|nr:hypothetical protein [Myxococcota bacterium]
MNTAHSAHANARDRAAEFVAAHGSPLARARAAALVGAGPVAAALEQLDPLVADGTPDSLLLTLRVCDELGARADLRVERACLRLAAAQRADGGFDLGSDDLDRRVVYTGMAAGLLAKTPFARPEMLEAAGDFLAAHFSPERVQGFRFDDVIAYASFFANALHEQSDPVLQWCGRELERGFRARAFGAVRTALVFACCDAHALPGARLSPDELRAALHAEQSADGGFGLPVAPAFERVDESLDALVALRHLRA